MVQDPRCDTLHVLYIVDWSAKITGVLDSIWITTIFGVLGSATTAYFRTVDCGAKYELPCMLD